MFTSLATAKAVVTGIQHGGGPYNSMMILLDWQTVELAMH